MHVADVIRLLLVDDSPYVTLALQAAFEDIADVELIQTAESVAEALAMTEQHEPDVVLLDRRLPDGDGVDAIGPLLTKRPDVRVLLFTGSADRNIADRVAAEGGSGVLLKAGLIEDLANAIRTVAAGQTVFGRNQMPDRPAI